MAGGRIATCRTCIDSGIVSGVRFSAIPLMAGERTAKAIPPQFSIVIPVHDDWGRLEGCLRSLAEQAECPDFEVVVVDDGSREPAPESIRRWNKSYPLSIIRQANAGVASARNRGIQESSGAVLVFTDADCRLQANCLSCLAATLVDSPQYDYLQLHITGDCSNLIGRAEELRLIAIQERALQPDGHIRYLNTSGFAIRKSRLGSGPILFDPAARRGEDTLLLAKLIQRVELPVFVSDCVVQHSISLSLWGCLLKDVRKSRLEGRALTLIESTGVRVRMNNKDRFRMLVSTWKMARNPMIGRTAWAVLLARQLVERTVTAVFRYLPLW